MNILGTDYKIEVNDGIQEKGVDGLCHVYTKLIEIVSPSSMLDSYEKDELKQTRFNEVLRHEIIHAFFHEAGNDTWCDDEALVQFLAIQFPKLVQLFTENDCMT